MNIVKENIDNLNMVLTVEVSKDDYQANVSKQLKDYQKKASMPGFRPGKVPVDLLKKMYGTAMLSEEVNKVAVDALYKFIEENKIEYLGNPIINTEKTKYFDWTFDADYTFVYDLGLAPKVEDKVMDLKKVEYYDIQVDDDKINKQIESYQRRYGKFSTPEECDVTDAVWGNFEELNEDGTVKEGGINHKANVLIESLTKDGRKFFVGAKKGGVVKLNPSKVFTNESDLAAMLGIAKEEVKDLKSDFQFTVENISRVELAPLDQDLFNKVYGEGVVNSEEELRAKISEGIAAEYVKYSDMKFYADVREKMIEKAELDLPNDFLKNWIMKSADKQVTMEQVEAEYEAYARSIKWQLIENKLLKDNDIKIEEAEIKEHIKENTAMQLARMYNMHNLSDEQLDGFVQRMMQDKESVKKAYDELYDIRLTALLKEKIKLTHKKISFDDFMEEINKNR